MTEPEPLAITIGHVIMVISAAFGISPQQLRSANKSARFVRPRYIAMLLARDFTHATLVTLARECGGRDHSTVRHGILRAAAMTPLEEIERLRKACVRATSSKMRDRVLATLAASGVPAEAITPRAVQAMTDLVHAAYLRGRKAGGRKPWER